MCEFTLQPSYPRLSTCIINRGRVKSNTIFTCFVLRCLIEYLYSTSKRNFIDENEISLETDRLTLHIVKLSGKE
jgi:hypothetical protein